MVLLHEIAHIKRCDGLVQMFQAFIRAAYFFHPLVWLLDRRLNQYREMACDDAASRGREGGPERYSKYLLKIAESTFHDPVAWGPAPALLRRRNQLLNRVKYQMKEGAMQVISTKRKGLVLAGLMLLILPLSWYCSSAEQAKDISSVSQAASRKMPDGMVKIAIRVRSESRVVVDGEEIALGLLEQRLRERVGDARDQAIILLECDDGINMDVVHSIRKRLVDMELRKVIFSEDDVGELPLMLPDKGDEERLAQIPEENVAVLRVDAFGKAFLDDEPVEFAGIEDAVRKRLSENDKLIISIQTLGVSPYGDFATLLALVKAAGATRISIGIPADLGD
jgi:biopolymer transport protein ExbD